MIDLHCHILPGVDDGPATMEDSIAMARQAAADGIDTVCATPHIRHDHDVRIRELASRAEALNAELHGAGVDVTIGAAGEVAETAVDGLSDDELRTVALSERWVLLEPAPGPLGDSLVAAAERLGRRGYRAVIAHPERHPGVDMAARLAVLVRSGCLVQATAALIAEGPASEPLLGLARQGLVHVLGSDSHSARVGRPLRISQGLDRLRGDPGLSPHVEWISELAPAAILAGEDIEPPLPVAS